MAQQRVGFIGLGNMGKPMSRNLLRAGFGLVVYDVRPEPMAELAREGASAARSPREVAERSDIVLTMLPTSKEVEEVVTGRDGVLEGLRPGGIVVEMSTIDPAVTKEVAGAVAARGGRMIDAAVGKTAIQAVEGTLTFMVGGEAGVLEICRPVLLGMGTSIFHCGPIGTGVTTKLVNNLVSCTTVLLVSEAMVLGAKAGLKVESMLEVLSNTGAANFQLDSTFRKKTFRGDLQPGFRLLLAHKDVSLALGLASSVGAPLMLGGLARELYSFAKARGLGELDFAAYMTLLEEAADVKVRYEGVED